MTKIQNGVTAGELHQKNYVCTAQPSYLKIRCFIASYVQPIIQQYDQQLFETNFCNQSSNYDNFCYEWKPLCAYHKINSFCGEWDTCIKEGTGESIKNALYALWYGKKH